MLHCRILSVCNIYSVMIVFSPIRNDYRCFTMAKDPVTEFLSNPLFKIDPLDYPRPQLVRDRYQKLYEWDFSFDDDDKGVAENWQAAASLDKKIIVPFPYQSKA